MRNLTDDQEAQIARLLADAAAADAVSRPGRYEAVHADLLAMNADFNRKLAVATLWFESFDATNDSGDVLVAANAVAHWLHSGRRFEELAEFCVRALARPVVHDEFGMAATLRWLLADARLELGGGSAEAINEYLIQMREVRQGQRDPLLRGQACLELAVHLTDRRRFTGLTDRAAIAASVAEAESCLREALDCFVQELDHRLHAIALAALTELQIDRTLAGDPADFEDLLAAVVLEADLHGGRVRRRRAEFLLALAHAARGNEPQALAAFAHAERPTQHRRERAIALQARLHRAAFLDRLGRHDEAAAARAGAGELLKLYELERLGPLLQDDSLGDRQR